METTDSMDTCRAVIDDCDGKIYEAFARRMAAARAIGEYKKEHGLPVFDGGREEAVLHAAEKRAEEAPSLLPYYRGLMKKILSLSRAYQRAAGADIPAGVPAVPVLTEGDAYAVLFDRGGRRQAERYFSLSRQVLILTDDGVPAAYAEEVRAAVLRAGGTPEIYTVPAGETSKSLDMYGRIACRMEELHFDRTAAVVTVGGGMVCDLGGFVAATYERGIALYHIPTTLLAMADASVGGKCAVNHSGYKNMLGAFYAPRRVLCDVGVLETLSDRLMAEGYAEIIKIALVADESLYRRLSAGQPKAEDVVDILFRAVELKAAAVMADEYDGGTRKLLNFGHTFGHAVESASGGRYLHGECVAMGMLPFLSDELYADVSRTLAAYELPTHPDGIPVTAAESGFLHDKKRRGNDIDTVRVDEVGKGYIRRENIEKCKELLIRWLKT